LLILTACGTAGTVAAGDAGEVADATLAPDASRPPLTPECQARVANTQAASSNSISSFLDDAELPPRIPEFFRGGEQVPDLRRDDYSSDIIHGQAERGPATTVVSWDPRWRGPELGHSTFQFSRARAYLACDEPFGNHEPGSEVVNRVDDTNGQLLFLGGSTSITAGVFSLPKAVPLPAGLSFAWAPNTNDTCSRGDAALLVKADGVEHVVRGGDAVDVALAGTTFTAMVSNGYAPPATGNYCGHVEFILFKKGLFVPPAN
jgi:hypothetical protein